MALNQAARLVGSVDSQSRIPLYGYFETNSAGGFNDITFADNLAEDHYKIYFADDANGDGTFDIGAKRVWVDLTIPCPSGGESSPMPTPSPAPATPGLQWLKICKSIEWGLVHTCDTYVTSDGSLTDEGN